MFILLLNFNKLLLFSYSKKSSRSELKFNLSFLETLTTVIGIFIIYMEPLMMIIDFIASLFNQKNLISCLNRIEKVDEKLARENILLDFKQNQVYSYMFIGLTVVCELSLNIMNIMIFSENFNLSSTAMWILSCGPLMINGIARTWFLQMLLLIKQRLHAINNYLDDTKNLFLEKKFHKASHPELQENLFDVNFGYLEKEIFTLRTSNLIHGDNKWDNLANKFDENMKSTRKHYNNRNIDVQPYKKSKMSHSNFMINDKMDKKLIIVCRLHDEICEIAKLINKMFSFQMLIIFAYGFMSITAKFYFLYCYLVSQDIPVLFRSASNIYISVFFITYTAYKFVIIIWIAYKTR